LGKFSDPVCRKDKYRLQIIVFIEKQEFNIISMFRID
jgi:hypothetical protein